MYINSSDIKMYPSSTRSDTYDRFSKLNTEHNLINIVNRLTGIDSFVISGLNISDNTIEAGSCNIHGYLFSLANPVILDSDLSAEDKLDNYLCLTIKVLKNESGFGELVNFDTEEVADIDNTQGIFKGLSITISDNLDIETTEDNRLSMYKLPLAVSNGVSWTEYLCNDGIGLKRANTFKYDAQDIKVKTVNSNNQYESQEQDLITFLTKNQVIDDGEV